MVSDKRQIVVQMPGANTAECVPHLHTGAMHTALQAAVLHYQLSATETDDPLLRRAFAHRAAVLRDLLALLPEVVAALAFAEAFVRMDARWHDDLERYRTALTARLAKEAGDG